MRKFFKLDVLIGVFSGMNPKSLGDNQENKHQHNNNQYVSEIYQSGFTY